MIPKENGDSRPLGIPNPNDKIVQKSMVNALNRIYEPIFKESSHGFRPRRSTHSALNEVKKWTGVK
jgi:RNA-directed DNA polymerase